MSKEKKKKECTACELQRDGGICHIDLHSCVITPPQPNSEGQPNQITMTHQETKIEQTTIKDHYCCWEQESPACGLKVKHLHCCLCKKLYPDIENEKSS